MVKTIKGRNLGIDQGDVQLFSDFENGGDMWTGSGPRERRERVTFSETFAEPPVVQVAVSLWDVSNGANLRTDIGAENIDTGGFDLVFRTWQDSQVARVRLNWVAFGALSDEEIWDV